MTELQERSKKCFTMVWSKTVGGRVRRKDENLPICLEIAQVLSKMKLQIFSLLSQQENCCVFIQMQRTKTEVATFLRDFFATSLLDVLS